MGTARVQLITLLAVLIGAFGSFASTRYIEREKRRFQRDSRWDERKLEAYISFADAVKEVIQISQRMVANRGLGTSTPIPLDEGLELLAEAERRQGVQWEAVLLMGNPETIVAASKWRHAAWHLEWFGRGLRDGREEYEAAAKESGRARRAYYDLARRDLAISSEPLPELTWPPAWRRETQAPEDDADD